MTPHCSYCGSSRASDKEHVFPRSLYPASKEKSKVQRLTIPSCNVCNNSWADDEAHFRNVLALAGEPNAARMELWETSISRSFRERDGPRRIEDIFAQMKPVEIDGRTRHKIYPAKDERVVRIVRKAIRGLCHYHGIMSAVSERRIWVDVLKYQVPPEFLNAMSYEHREQDIVEYRFQVIKEHDIHTAWLLTFFQRVTFVGIVSISEDGFNPDAG